MSTAVAQFDQAFAQTWQEYFHAITELVESGGQDDGSLLSIAGRLGYNVAQVRTHLVRLADRKNAADSLESANKLDARRAECNAEFNELGVQISKFSPYDLTIPEKKSEAQSLHVQRSKLHDEVQRCLREAADLRAWAEFTLKKTARQQPHDGPLTWTSAIEFIGDWHDWKNLQWDDNPKYEIVPRPEHRPPSDNC